MFSPPNPKKLAYDRSVREREELRKQQIETCYSKHKTAQERFVEFQAAQERIRAQIEDELGIGVHYA